MMETERILLRPFRDSDEEILFDFINDPEVAYNTGWSLCIGREDSRSFLLESFNNDHTWVIELKGTGDTIGCIHHDEVRIPIQYMHDKNQREVGFWIGRPYWNHGFCTEALRLLVDHCFNKIGVTALWGGCYIENQASARVMEKCGFIDEMEGQGPNGRPARIMKLEKR